MPSDKERLDWLEQNHGSIYYDERLRRWGSIIRHPYPKEWEYVLIGNLRETIDAAIRATKPRKGGKG